MPPLSPLAGAAAGARLGLPRSGLAPTPAPPLALLGRVAGLSATAGGHSGKSPVAPGRVAVPSATAGGHSGKSSGAPGNPSPFHGRSFACTECGKCCSGPGDVWVDKKDCERLSAHLGLTLREFHFRFTDRRLDPTRPGFRALKNRPGSEDCVFLEGGLLCSVHAARPVQCSTYPYWPELEGDDDWEMERESVCEGMDHPDAPEVDTEVATEQNRIYREHFGMTGESSAVGGVISALLRKL